MYNADVIVFEHLDRKGKVRGSKKQRLHMWRSQYVQSMVENKAHRLSMRVSHICAWGTSRLAFDGSGYVLRGKDADLNDVAAEEIEQAVRRDRSDRQIHEQIINCILLFAIIYPLVIFKLIAI